MFTMDHVTISVNNLESTLNFYYKFGFKKINEYSDNEVDIVHLKLDNMILEIFHYNNNYELPEHSKTLSTDLVTIGNKHFGLGVDNIYDAKKFVEDNNLNKEEIEISIGRLGRSYFFIKDPDGILIEIIENK